MSAYSSAAVRNTRLTGVINRRNNMAKIQHSHVPVAPSHGQVSTTFTSMLSLSLHSQRLHANTDFKEDLALHYSKVKKWKVFFFLNYFLFVCRKNKRSQRAATQCSTSKPLKNALLLSRYKAGPSLPLPQTEWKFAPLYTRHQQW